MHFWYAHALALAGRVRQAREVFHRALACKPKALDSVLQYRVYRRDMRTTEDHIQEGTERFLLSMHGNLDANERDIIPLLARMAVDDELVTIDRLVTATGWDPEAIRVALVKFPQVDFDEQGRITGLYAQSPHWSIPFTVDGRTLYGCASDTLTFPVILGRAGVVEATCPATGTPIRIELTPTGVRSVDPPRAVVSKVRPTEGITNMLAEVCGLGHFYSSPDAAADWLARNPDGFVDTVADDFEIHRRGITALGWAVPLNG